MPLALLVRFSVFFISFIFDLLEEEVSYSLLLRETFETTDIRFGSDIVKKYNSVPQ